MSETPFTSKDRSLGPAPLPTWHGKGCICNQYSRKDCPALQTPEGQERERARELNSTRCRLREAEIRWSEAGGEVARLRAVLKRMSTGNVPATDFVQLSKDALVGSPDETTLNATPGAIIAGEDSASLIPESSRPQGLLQSSDETSGSVEAELDEDRRIFGMAYWLETAGGKVRLNPEELRMRMSDGRFRVVADMDTVAQQQAVFDFVVSLRRDAYNAQRREPFIPIGPDGQPGSPEKAGEKP